METVRKKEAKRIRAKLRKRVESSVRKTESGSITGGRAKLPITMWKGGEGRGGEGVGPLRNTFNKLKLPPFIREVKERMKRVRRRKKMAGGMGVKTGPRPRLAGRESLNSLKESLNLSRHTMMLRSREEDGKEKCPATI